MGGGAERGSESGLSLSRPCTQSIQTTGPASGRVTGAVDCGSRKGSDAGRTRMGSPWCSRDAAAVGGGVLLR